MITTSLAFTLATHLTNQSTETPDGHRIWTGDWRGKIKAEGSAYTYRQAAHLIRTGYPAQGQLRTTCGTPGCFLHTTDLGTIPAETTTPLPQWRDRAACLDHDDELWFPEDHKGPSFAAEAEAVAICETCPVRAYCLDAALTIEGGLVAASRHGIRGGLTGPQRHGEYHRRLKRRKRVEATA